MIGVQPKVGLFPPVCANSLAGRHMKPLTLGYEPNCFLITPVGENNANGNAGITAMGVIQCHHRFDKKRPPMVKQQPGGRRSIKPSSPLKKPSGNKRVSLSGNEIFALNVFQPVPRT